MSDFSPDKKRRPLKNLPPDRFQPKVLLIWLSIVAAVLALFYLPATQVAAVADLKIQEVVTLAEQNKILKGEMRPDAGVARDWYTFVGETTEATLPDGKGGMTKHFKAQGRVTDANHQRLQATNAFKETSPSTWAASLMSMLPILIVVGLLYFMFVRQLRNAGRGALTFGKSRARMLTRDRDRVTFPDVAGCDEAKEEIAEVVEFLKDPKKFTKMGAKIPKGILMVGPPGTGKTLLAKAVAGEADVPFFSISGSDFVEMFVGVGASRVRDMFEQGRKNAPCIIFIDEIDAVGRQRGAGLGGGNDEREQTLNSLLVEMDGFDTTEGVIIIAATNRADVLDNALLRPGRFDRQVHVGLPDLVGREQILRVHARKLTLADDVDLTVLARASAGFSGADLANLLNEGALVAARRNKKRVEMIDIEDARDKVLFGREHRRVMTDAEKKALAYHEAGHAIVGAVLDDGTLPVHKVTIIPRGNALGSTQYVYSRDLLGRSKKFYLNRICTAMAGRIAEKFVTDDISDGASGDIRSATKLARAMVCDFGMSDLGPISFGDNQDTVFLGREITRNQHVSDETARLIDAAITDIVNSEFKRAESILTEHREALDKISNALLVHETIEGKHVHEILKFGELRSPVVPQNLSPKPAEKPVDKKPADKPSSEDIGGTAPAPTPA